MKAWPQEWIIEDARNNPRSIANTTVLVKVNGYWRLAPKPEPKR